MKDNIHFSCHDGSDELIIDTLKSNPDDVFTFLEENKKDIVSKSKSKDPQKRFMTVKVTKGQVPMLCVRLGLFNLD